MFTAALFHELDDPALIENWASLSKRGVLTNFQTLEYVKPMARHLAELSEAQPLFVVVYQEPEQTPVLILPLQKKRHFGIERLDFLDYWVADHQLPIFDPTAFENELAAVKVQRVVLDALQGHDVLAIRAMPNSWNGIPNPLAGIAPSTKPSTASYRLQLDDDSLAKARKQSSVYKQCRRAQRRLESELGIEMVEIRQTDDINSAFDAMAVQRQAKFSGLSGRDNFDNVE
ncbi:MAG: hypothetical protein AAF141_12585, partial [Pseudomonadota bacterium]